VETLASKPPAARAFGAPEVTAAVLVAAALAWAYAPNFVDLVETWDHDSNANHGFLVIPIALGLLWHRRDKFRRDRFRPNPLGWVLLAAVLGLRAFLYEVNEMWVESATIPLAVAALTLAFGGWWTLLWAAPSIGFLWFMMPLPPSFNTFLAQPLQQLATLGSTTILHLLGLPVLAEGNVIFIGIEKLEVERACNGLSMLQSFVALIAATTIVLEAPIWEKGLLLASAVPIALISNILRIVLTAYAYHQFGPTAILWGDWTIAKVSHDTAGFAMMPIALMLVWIQIRLVRWLVIVEEDDSSAKPLGGLIPQTQRRIEPT